MALYAVPAGMLVNAIFLLSWRLLPPLLPSMSHKRQLLSMVSLSLLIWVTMGLVGLFGLRLIDDKSLHTALLLTIIGLILGILGCRKRIPAPSGKHRVSLMVLIARGVFAAIAIGSAVWVSGLGLPIIAGLASVFPAIFMTTMVSVWLAQGEAVVIGAVGPMMLGGVSVSLYSLLAAWFFPELGPLYGGFLAWILSVLCISVPAWMWLEQTKSNTMPVD